jgi:hypothetical protein
MPLDRPFTGAVGGYGRFQVKASQRLTTDMRRKAAVRHAKGNPVGPEAAVVPNARTSKPKRRYFAAVLLAAQTYPIVQNRFKNRFKSPI